MKRIIIVLLITFLMTGCYNYKELNKIAIVSSISIDKKNNEYLVGAQVMNIKNKDESNKSSIIVYEETGKTIEEALRKMTKISNKKLYGGHLSKLVISEEIAKEGIINVIDIFQRLPEIKDEFTITVAKGIEANKVIKIITSSSEIPADYVKSQIESADLESALTYSSKLDEFVSYYLKDYVDPVITVIKVENYNSESDKIENSETSNPETRIILNNIATTKNGKLETFLNEDETIGYNYITDNVQNMIIPVKCDNNHYASISINENKTKIKVKKDNKYIIDININNTGEINEYNCKKKIDEKVINELEKETKKQIKKYINSAINVKSKSNFLGLKRQIYLKYPNYNNEEYSLNIRIKMNINSKGEINEYKN